MSSKEISNLGIESSTRYAQDREVFDASLIKDATQVSAQTRVATTIPTFESEFDALFDLQARGKQWATFPAPPTTFRPRAFSFQLIPALGTPEQQEALLGRLSQLPPSPDAEKIQNLCATIRINDDLVIDSNAKRRQYGKG